MLLGFYDHNLELFYRLLWELKRSFGLSHILIGLKQHGVLETEVFYGVRIG